MNNTEPKKHHYVPQCYLKAFSNSQKQLWRRSKRKNKCSICSPAQIGYEIDTNKIRTKEVLLLNEISDPNHIEKQSFKKQENNYPKILPKIIRFNNYSFVVEKNEYRLFLETLITVKRRNPQTRQLIIKKFIDGYNAPEVIPACKSYLLEEAAKNNVTIDEDIDKRIKEYYTTRTNNPEWLHDMYLIGYLKSTDYDIIEKMTGQLYSLKQFVLHAPLNIEFITSDNPGFTVSNGSLLNAGGFGSKFEFYFPLTPKTCLYINSELKEDSILIEKRINPILIPNSRVTEINRFTKDVSNNLLFGYTKAFLELL